MIGTIQIAGAIDEKDALTIIESGADEIALPVGPFLKTPELTDLKARELFLFLKGKIRTLAITYLTDAKTIAELLQQLGINRVQLHGSISVAETYRLKEMMPCFVMKSVAIGQFPFEKLKCTVDEFSQIVDAFIFDTFDSEDQSTGATGKTHNWSVSRDLVLFADRPVILAGGLDPNNVRHAIEFVRPQGVDAHTRLEGSDGRKDPELLGVFVKNARQAFG